VVYSYSLLVFLLCVLRTVVHVQSTKMFYNRLLVFYLISISSSFVVCGGKFSLSVGRLYLRTAWSLTIEAFFAVSKVPRHLRLPSTVSLA
jgi:hypothetical protein